MRKPKMPKGMKMPAKMAKGMPAFGKPPAKKKPAKPSRY